MTKYICVDVILIAGGGFDFVRSGKHNRDPNLKFLGTEHVNAKLGVWGINCKVVGSRYNVAPI